MPAPVSPDREQLIGALIPTASKTPQPGPLPQAILTVPRQTAGEPVLLAAARVDASGRVPVRGFCAVMGWRPGQQLAATTAQAASKMRSGRSEARGRLRHLGR